MSDLEQFVLNYLEEAGSIVDPPAYGIYDVLLPEELAKKWRLPAFLQLAFSETQEEEAIRLGYNHPLVDQMVQDAHLRTASARLYISNLRLQKSGVDELAMKSWVILNARTEPIKRAMVNPVRSTYVRFNFKAAILSVEKQERLVSVLMDAHTGCRVEVAEPIEFAAVTIAPDNILAGLSDGPMRWQSADGSQFKAPLDEKPLSALLDRAQASVLEEMQGGMAALQNRLARFRYLDEARLIDYYDTLEKDLQTRLKTASAERRGGLQDKLTAVQAERRHKLDDLAERFQVRVNLTLLNVLVIQQPKLIQRVKISNRRTTITTYAVWDPLLHQIEPLHCQVCEQPGGQLYLCQNGHLAHGSCLAPECVRCKRVFCRDCAHEVGSCAVCHQPLCRYSRLTCSECGRHTCQEHQEMCHANDGQPLDLTKPTAPAEEPAPSPPEKITPAGRSKPGRTKKPSPKSKSGSRSKPAPRAKTGPRALRMEVVLHHDTITAYLLGKRDREIAVRSWQLVPNEGGILQKCHCEKGTSCPADRMIMMPFKGRYLEKQLKDGIYAFAREYDLPRGKVYYNRLSYLSGEPYTVPRFELFGLWENEAALTEAQDAFIRLYR